MRVRRIIPACVVMVLAFAIPAGAAEPVKAPAPDLARLGALTALILSELMPFLPTKAKGILHGMLLLLRGLVEGLS